MEFSEEFFSFQIKFNNSVSDFLTIVSNFVTALSQICFLQSDYPLGGCPLDLPCPVQLLMDHSALLIPPTVCYWFMTTLQPCLALLSDMVFSQIVHSFKT